MHWGNVVLVLSGCLVFALIYEAVSQWLEAPAKRSAVRFVVGTLLFYAIFSNVRIMLHRGPMGQFFVEVLLGAIVGSLLVAAVLLRSASRRVRGSDPEF